ncbi:MAG TPA: DUF1772 domain-containing protein [Edaphobacter sp.]
MAVAYDAIAATVAAAMAGNEFAVAAFVHPQLYRLDDEAHARAASLFAKTLGKWMPLWYPLALLLMLGAFWEHRPGTPSMLILAAGILWALIIVWTILVLVPINNRISRLDPQRPYEGWRDDRARWDRLHRIRVGLLILAVFMFLMGLLPTWN